MWHNFPSVTVTIKARVVVVKGPRGQITKDMSHLNVDMRCMTQKDAKTGKVSNAIRIRMWFGSYKQKCQVKTVHTLLNTMINGTREVSISIHYSMRKVAVLLLPYRSFEVLTGVWYCSLCSSALIKLIINSRLLLGCPIQDETRLRSFPH